MRGLISILFSREEVIFIHYKIFLKDVVEVKKESIASVYSMAKILKSKIRKNRQAVVDNVRREQ